MIGKIRGENKMEFLLKYDNFAAVQFKFSNEELAPIWNEVNEIFNSNFTNGKKYNQNLAGNIEHEFLLHKSLNYIDSLLKPAIVYHIENFDYIKKIHILSKDAPISLQQVWVNFQKKHEFNPLHHHTGIFSFVIWLKVPFYFEKEKQINFSKNSGHPCPGIFEFIYLSQKDGIPEILQEKIPVDKNYENHGVLFPSNLNHSVYPFFTSDEYRISISGNYFFRT